jgi:hypothetical protein
MDVLVAEVGFMQRRFWASLTQVEKLKKGNPMTKRTVISIAAAAILGIACVSTDALAYRGGVRVGGMHRGGAYRGAYVRHWHWCRCRWCGSGSPTLLQQGRMWVLSLSTLLLIFLRGVAAPSRCLSANSDVSRYCMTHERVGHWRDSFCMRLWQRTAGDIFEQGSAQTGLRLAPAASPQR